MGGPPAGQEAVRPHAGAPAEAGGGAPGVGPAAVEEAAAGEREEEVQRVKRLRVPRTPSAAEVEEHEDQGHVQYRSWCGICAGARGTGSRHVSRGGADADADPIVAMDYCFVTKDGKEGWSRKLMRQNI